MSRNRRAKPAGTKQSPSPRSWSSLPPWISALAAVVGTTLAVVLAFGLLDKPAPTPAPTQASVATTAPDLRVTLESVTTGPEVSGHGSYRHLDVRSELILFLGRNVGPTGEPWIPVVAELEPLPGASADIQDGSWQAARPSVVGSYTWGAVIAPVGASAGDVYEDIRRNGPNSQYVLARSEFQTTQ